MGVELVSVLVMVLGWRLGLGGREVESLKVLVIQSPSSYGSASTLPIACVLHFYWIDTTSVFI